MPRALDVYAPLIAHETAPLSHLWLTAGRAAHHYATAPDADTRIAIERVLQQAHEHSIGTLEVNITRFLAAHDAAARASG
jgi:hypothetical protein